MVKTLKPIGNSYGLIIDKPILRLLNIDSDTRLELNISDDGRGIEIRPVTDEGHRERVREAGRRMIDVHRESFRKLAE